MKKLSILLIGLLLISGFAFAEMTEEEVVAAIEDLQTRVDAVEASAITATGSIEFVFGGDLNPKTPNLPRFSDSVSATGTLSLATADDKVTATIGLNLLGAPSVATTITQPSVTIGGIESTLTEWLNATNWVSTFDGIDAVYLGWGTLKDQISFWNDQVDEDVADIMAAATGGAATAGKFNFDYTWRSATLGTLEGPYEGDPAIVRGTTDFSAELFAKVVADQLWGEDTIGGTATLLNLVDEVDSDGTITLKSLVAPSATPDDDEFNFAGAGDTPLTTGGAWYNLVGGIDPEDWLDDVVNAGTANPFEAQLYGAGGGFDAYLEEELDDFYTDEIAGFLNAFGNLIGTLEAVGYDGFKDLTAAERAALKTAVDAELTLLNALAPAFGDFSATSTVTYNPITSATLKIVGIGGLIDLTAGINGGNVGVDGGIFLDGKGHSDDTVKSYQYLTLGLTSGVVDGLTANVTIYSDDNDAKDFVPAIDAKWYTLLDDSEAEKDVVEPKLALGTTVGYSMEVMDGVTVGGTAKIGFYDMLSDDDSEFGFSINPTFSGFGATANIIYGMGLGMTHVYVGADYTVMGVTPSVGFRLVQTTDDYAIAYVADAKYNSGTAAVLGEGGTAVEFGLKADLSNFVPVGATVGGAGTLAMPEGFETNVLGWNASLSVTPIDIVTVSGAIAATGINNGDAEINPLTWNGTVKAALLPDLTLTGAIAQRWNATNAEGYLAPSASLEYKYSAATLTASYGTGYDATAAADARTYATYAFGMKVSF